MCPRNVQDKEKEFRRKQTKMEGNEELTARQRRVIPYLVGAPSVLGRMQAGSGEQGRGL
jgi:hypothetical protein